MTIKNMHALLGKVDPWNKHTDLREKGNKVQKTKNPGRECQTVTQVTFKVANLKIQTRHK